MIYIRDIAMIGVSCKIIFACKVDVLDFKCLCEGDKSCIKVRLVIFGHLLGEVEAAN